MCLRAQTRNVGRGAAVAPEVGTDRQDTTVHTKKKHQRWGNCARMGKLRSQHAAAGHHAAMEELKAALGQQKAR